MLPCLRALLNQVIDYAGLFPPAELAMEPAIRHYARYMSEPESWMLGRFICPAARLEELHPFITTLFYPVSPLTLSVLGRGGTNADDFLAGLHADLQAIAAFRQRHGPRVLVDALEIKWPTALCRLQTTNELRHLLEQTANVIEAEGPPQMHIAYEAGFSPDGRAAIDAIVQTLAESAKDNRSKKRQKYASHGFKLRCGGVQAAAFPAPEQVAWVLSACSEHAVPLKFTAGLHHPLRHYANSVQTKMHGFINVLLASVVAFEEKWDVNRLVELLNVEGDQQFHPTSEGWIWAKYLFPTDMVSSVRTRFGLSFGSCSFDEPRDDLRGLGWL